MKDYAKTRSEIVDRGIKSFRNQDVWFASVLIKLLAEGNPLSVEELASEGGWSEEKLRKALKQHPGIEYDEYGRITGFGLTLNPTSHRFDFDGKTVYGWCASDALSFPMLLGKSGIVTSTCPVTKQKIRIKITPDKVLKVDPPDAVVSSVRPAEKVDDVRSDICSVGLFFSSSEVASQWVKAYPDGFLHSVEEDFEVHRQVLGEVGWLDNKTG